MAKKQYPCAVPDGTRPWWCWLVYVAIAIGLGTVSYFLWYLFIHFIMSH